VNEYFLRIYNVIQKFNLDLFLVHKVDCINTSAFVKYNFKTRGMIKDILKYESEFQSIIPGCWLESKNGYISICIPKEKSSPYPISELLESDFYRNNPSVLKIALGENPDGGIVVGNLEKWINVLIAGTPGSGKSNLLNVMINCFAQQDINDLRLVLFDLKEVELKQYNCLPHLLKPVITDINRVQYELLSLITEMQRRYKILEQNNCRNIQTYRKKNGDMPYLVVVIDELAEIILTKKECENQIVRLAQKGRACGIHLVIATQKPNSEIVTSLIKGSIDTRISFKVASHYDSQVILDMSGAEKLGKCGDMLLRDEDGLQRIQCCYISDEEIGKNLEQFKNGTEELIEVDQKPKQLEYVEAEFTEVSELNEQDVLYKQALNFIKDTNKCNLWALKRHLRIGNKKANNIVEQLIKNGDISQRKVGNDYEILKGGKLNG